MGFLYFIFTTIMLSVKFNDNLPGPIFIGTKLANELGFTEDKFSGYLWDSCDGSIVISLITSLHPGKGNVRNLIDTLKSKYKKIYVPVPSARMRMICEKSGFKLGFLPDDEMGACEAMVYEEV